MPLSDSQWSISDRKFMARAIKLARNGLYTTDPNPRVGCVIADEEGRQISAGWHKYAGEPHAEINALNSSLASVKNGTAFVTLEPCSHQGKTGPCAKALIEAGLKRVVVAMEDPNPLVAGKGLQLLEEHGVEVSCGLLAQEAEELNPGFVKRMREGRPFVRIKMAVSLDGRTAMASGESQWITGPEARSVVQSLRARSSAVITGSGSVMLDDPSMTVRSEELSWPSIDSSVSVRQPLRVILNSDAELTGQEKIFRQPGPILVVHGENSSVSERLKSAAQVGMLALPLTGQGNIPLDTLLAELAHSGCNEVLVEAGAKLAGAFFEKGLWDELVIFMAPKVLGSRARPLFDIGFDRMADSEALKLRDLRQIGADIQLTYTPA